MFLESASAPGDYSVMLPSVCSQTIFDSKSRKELQIADLSETAAPVAGGKKIILLCEKVAREDIKVRFYDPDSQWEGWGDFQPADVHKQYAISLKTPRYQHQDITEKKRVFIELVKPSDSNRSDPKEFFFLPLERNCRGKKNEEENIINHFCRNPA